MKTLLALTTALLAGTAYAGTGDVGTARAEYKLVSVDQRSGANLCADKIVINQVQNAVVIENVRDLAEQFGQTPSMRIEDIGKLVIANINEGPQKDVQTTHAHGDRISTSSQAVFERGVLTLKEVTKFGYLFRSVATGELKISFHTDGVVLNIERSYDEAFSKSRDWKGSLSCKYSLVK